MKKLKKTKSRRERSKYPGLNPKLTTRIRQDLLDFDYIHLLNDEQKEFLNKFAEEEINSAFKNDGTDFNQSKEDRKKIYDRNNAANRCLYSNLKNKANKHNNKRLVNYENVVADIEDSMNQGINPMNLENAYTEYLEFKEIEVMLEEYDSAMLLMAKEPE